jgi:hypothetical protein
VAYTFTPPTRTIRIPRGQATNGLLARLSLQAGVTVLKEDGFYRQVIEPTAEEVEAADAAYVGGRGYTIDSAEQAAWWRPATAPTSRERHE